MALRVYRNIPKNPRTRILSGSRLPSGFRVEDISEFLKTFQKAWGFVHALDPEGYECCLFWGVLDC